MGKRGGGGKKGGMGRATDPTADFDASHSLHRRRPIWNGGETGCWKFIFKNSNKLNSLFIFFVT